MNRPTRPYKLLALTYIGVGLIVAGAAAWHLLGTADKGKHAGHHEHAIGVAHAQTGKQLYTCGMHPNVLQQGPGTCPICGMDLTPVKGGAAKKTKTKKGQRKIKHWAAPMDPTYIRDKPGKSPMGMDLVPVYEDEQPDSEGMITIDPVVVQNMGVRVAHVKRGSLSKRVRTIGEVVVAEDLVSVVNLKYSGWIERLYVDQTGVKVRQGQRLLSVYSPELVSAQEEYLLALRTAGADSPLARSARARLAFWDLGEATLAKIGQRGKAVRTLTITAPRSGFVLHKNVVQGAKANAGQDLFRIGRLDAIWVHARVYEFDAPWIRLGQKATMELSFEQGKQYRGKVSYIYPTLDPKTRTLTVRLEFVNPSLQLKPGMFTTVWIETRQKSGVLTVPTEAILHSGERNTVFAVKGMGRYEPRQVVTGLSGDGHVTEVLSGIKEGEAVVVSGQFLLDSESQLQEAMQKLLAARLQAKQGHQHKHEQGHEHKNKHKNKTVWTCPMHPQIVERKAGSCPICGMDLVKKKLP
jgi:Cu(I)/Ag(I) efflux system membrane fusion protein/cobalt-zinc-cadmium efflux system membrane fusion protein